MLRGIDISHWQGTINWPAVSQGGIEFAFIKAAEGVTYRDPRTVENVAQCRSAGIPCGLYHYFSPHSEPGAQAENFLSVARQVHLGLADLPPVLDLEVIGDPPVSNATYRRSLQQWIDVVQREIRRSVIIYVSPNFWNSHLRGFDTHGLTLWIAHWGVEAPQVPGGWTHWTFWQHSSKGTVGGITGNVDLDQFNGDVEEFRQFIQDSTLP